MLQVFKLFHVSVGFVWIVTVLMLRQFISNGSVGQVIDSDYNQSFMYESLSKAICQFIDWLCVSEPISIKYQISASWLHASQSPTWACLLCFVGFFSFYVPLTPPKAFANFCIFDTVNPRLLNSLTNSLMLTYLSMTVLNLSA